MKADVMVSLSLETTRDANIIKDQAPIPSELNMHKVLTQAARHYP
jgi:hypothetical protein